MFASLFMVESSLPGSMARWMDGLLVGSRGRIDGVAGVVGGRVGHGGGGGGRGNWG
jgi:hypothetical protein